MSFTPLIFFRERFFSCHAIWDTTILKLSCFHYICRVILRLSSTWWNMSPSSHLIQSSPATSTHSLTRSISRSASAACKWSSMLRRGRLLRPTRMPPFSCRRSTRRRCALDKTVGWCVLYFEHTLFLPPFPFLYRNMRRIAKQLLPEREPRRRDRKRKGNRHWGKIKSQLVHTIDYTAYAKFFKFVSNNAHFVPFNAHHTAHQFPMINFVAMLK